MWAQYFKQKWAVRTELLSVSTAAPEVTESCEYISQQLHRVPVTLWLHHTIETLLNICTFAKNLINSEKSPNKDKKSDRGFHLSFPPYRGLALFVKSRSLLQAYTCCVCILSVPVSISQISGLAFLRLGLALIWLFRCFSKRQQTGPEIGFNSWLPVFGPFKVTPPARMLPSRTF